MATLSNVILDTGSYSITAVYSGDDNFVTSTSSAVSESVTAASTSVSMSGATSGVFGQSLGVTATVAAVAPGGGTPTGSVSFYEGQTLLGTLTLVGGAATLSQGYSIGTHDISATFNPTGTDYSGSQSGGSQSVVVGEASTAVTLSSTTSTVFGQSASLTATVAAVSPGTGTPTGAIQFVDGQTMIGQVNLTGGSATLAIASLAVGADTITASYVSDGNYSASTTASSVTQVVSLATSQAIVTATQASGLVGQSVTFTATVSAVSPALEFPPAASRSTTDRHFWGATRSMAMVWRRGPHPLWPPALVRSRLNTPAIPGSRE